MPKNNFNQRGKRSVLKKLQNTEEIKEDTNKWKHIHMEAYVHGWKN